MIIGIGNDLINIKRIESTLSKFGDRFIKRVFTDIEIKKSEGRLKKSSSYAKRFAAKEAFSKAIGTGISKGINFNEIIVHNIKSGKPNIRLLGNTKKVVNKILNKKKFNIFLSLSDDKPFAVATVVISIWIKII